MKELRTIFCLKVSFGRKTKASYLMTETLMVQKLIYILAILCRGKWFPCLFSVLKKIYKLGKNSNSLFCGAFLVKRVDYSHGFSSVFFNLKFFFFDTPEVTKIVLPQKFYKILRSRQCIPVGARN